jgi:hypothetical protein
MTTKSTILCAEAPDRPPKDAGDRRSTTNVESNVRRGEVTMGEIAELRAEGIEVDNEDPAPENMVEPPPADAARLIGKWITPAICARKADAKIKNDEGRWKNREWSTIAEDTEFITFRMCFFENYVVDHMLPATNKYLSTPITLQEFYVFLGCNFFMACFEGISDRKEWWSKEPRVHGERSTFHVIDFLLSTKP